MLATNRHSSAGEDDAPELPEGVSLSKGETRELPALLKEIGSPLTPVEIDSYILDAAYARELEFEDFFARAFGREKLRFTDEAQQAVFYNYVEDRFEDPYSRTIAKSVVRLYNHTRNCIKIAPCANNTLLGRIQEKEERTGESFSEYLSQARWIHLSSLSDFEQFEVIMRYVIQAKMLNPALRVSMDPGFEYTSRRRERLQSLVSNSDYIFLNKAEKRNLGLNAERMRPLYRNLCEYFTEINPSPERTLIVKHDDRHELLRFHENKCRIRTIRHQKLYQYQLNNDTGAGDSFAGGFISGMLDDRINSDIAGPIQLGVLAAKGRMRSFDHENPYQNIQKLTDAFFASL